jgi:hypothetical protein
MNKLVATALLMVVGLGTGLFLSQYVPERFLGISEPLATNNSIIVVSK